jgi:hypothetical protein
MLQQKLSMVVSELFSALVTVNTHTYFTCTHALAYVQ